MKKLFFSAVALVAFSSVSMANNVAIEESKLIEKELKLVENECHAVSFYIYNSSRESGLSISQSTANANTAYWQCMGSAIPKSISAN